MGRVRLMITKYTKLEIQLRAHGVEFILATGKAPVLDDSKLQVRTSRKTMRS